ncbi:MAG: glycine cleavage system transcriptional repressor [Actinomycetota bacterium]|jgi:glycine cleavage system transcriptional repressor|nr:glycine cleavage system transcriptional repressor [Actinomycetota bacterium]
MRDEIIAVTVLGDDRPGIVAEVTRALADLHGNLEDSTMTLLRGHFAMVLLVHTGAGAAAVEAALHPLGADGSLVINARVLGDSSHTEIRGPSYALRVHGADRPGIVATITAVVARHGANIVDLSTRLIEGLYVMMAELQLAGAGTAAGLEADLQGAAGELGVEVHLSPVDDDLL